MTMFPSTLVLLVMTVLALSFGAATAKKSKTEAKAERTIVDSRPGRIRTAPKSNLAGRGKSPKQPLLVRNDLQGDDDDDDDEDDVKAIEQEEDTMSMDYSTSMSMSMSMIPSPAPSRISSPVFTGSEVDVGGIETEIVDRVDGCPFDVFGLPLQDCSAYPIGKMCQYNYQYDGCDWDVLTCNWIQECECLMDSIGADNPGRPRPPTWSCKSYAREACLNAPSDLPRGPCNPNQPLPTRPSQ